MTFRKSEKPLASPEGCSLVILIARFRLCSQRSQTAATDTSFISRKSLRLARPIPPNPTKAITTRSLAPFTLGIAFNVVDAAIMPMAEPATKLLRLIFIVISPENSLSGGERRLQPSAVGSFPSRNNPPLHPSSGGDFRALWRHLSQLSGHFPAETFPSRSLAGSLSPLQSGNIFMLRRLRLLRTNVFCAAVPSLTALLSCGRIL